jgi:purine nucleosidase
MRKFWIDTDTASDDAVALVMALRWPDVDVVGVSLVAGNVPVEQGAKNALYSIQMATTKHVPVYIGCAKPLLRPIEFATWFHGPDGMGGMNYPDAIQKADSKHAVDALIETVKANPGEITLVTLGPLTNIATALTRAPEIAKLIPRCVIMGGAANVVGNVTPAAEYNIWVDPEAASIVFHSGMNMEMVGWELCRFEAAIFPAEMEQILGFGTELAKFTVDCNRTALDVCVRVQKADGLTLADPVAMAVALDPDTVVARRGHYFVEVETLSPFMRGNTCVDELGVTRRNPNMHVIWAIHNARWKEILYQLLR